MNKTMKEKTDVKTSTDAKISTETIGYRDVFHQREYLKIIIASLINRFGDSVDAIAFTAGVGENDMKTRKAICSYLGYLGVEIDDEANNCRGKNQMISTADSKVKVMILPTNEELAIARETLRLTK